MTKPARRKYLREWRKHTAHRCECGQPGMVWNHGGMICERCSNLEYLRDLRESFKQHRRNRKGYLFGGLEEHRIVHDGRTGVRGPQE